MVSRRQFLVSSAALGGVCVGGYFFLKGSSYEEAADKLWSSSCQRSSSSIDYLVHYATLAANAHNTQPWLFSGDDKHIVVQADFSRSTPVVDPDNHHLYASLGCAIENLTLAAKAKGNSTDMNFVDDNNTAIRVDLSSGKTRDHPLFDAIVHRQCTRSIYDARKVSLTDLKTLENSARLPGSQVLLFTDRMLIDSISELILSASIAQINNPAFVKELKSWLRFSASSAIESGDGLFAACSGNPALPDWLGEPIFDLAFSAGSENKKSSQQLKSSSGLAVFVSDNNGPAQWVNAGRSYQRFALQATALGMKHAFLNQTVEVPKYRAELASLLKLGNKRPDFVVRFGYADRMPRSLRRPIHSVIV